MPGGDLSWLCVLCVIPAGWVTAGDSRDRLLQTEQGPVRGYEDDGIFVFYGIPYATAPVGKDKFKDPDPAPTWISTFDAVEKRMVCPQSTLTMMPSSNTKSQEDCLVANVYVPDTDEETLPVVVYVHGGAYQLGSGVFLEPKNLARSKKVVVVTFNYRLGIHGFLCLGTTDIPGNAGMKDQVALLRWVEKNIYSYGGNPKDVTIAGYSSGASSVDLLMLSPLAEGLFNKVIIESGASLASWSIQIDPLENAKTFAKSADFEDIDDIYALEEFFKNASIDLISSYEDYQDRTDFTVVFSPCVERKTAGAFLTDSPYNILKKGRFKKVPMLNGFSNMEGLLRFPEFYTFKDKMNANFSEFLPIDLKFESEEEREKVSKQIKRFYFGEKPVSEENILSYIYFMSDMYFTYSTLRGLTYNVAAGNDKIYLYEFNFVDESAPAIPHTNNVRGSGHCAQTLTIFDGIDWQSTDERNSSEDVKKVKSVTRELWVNFITTGSPVPAGSPLPAWPPLRAAGGPHMSLGRELQLRGALLEERVRFWDAIYDRHYREPQPPPTPPPRHSELQKQS